MERHGGSCSATHSIQAEITILSILPAVPDHDAGQWPLCPASFAFLGGLLTPTFPSAETHAWPGLALLAGSAVSAGLALARAVATSLVC